MKKTAVEYYKSGKGNCAQAVAYAWDRSTSSGADNLPRFSACGSGKAPEGLCGALYAAQILSGNENVKRMFAEKAGGYIACRDIRANRIMPCAECVALSSDILESVSE